MPHSTARIISNINENNHFNLNSSPKGVAKSPPSKSAATTTFSGRVVKPNKADDFIYPKLDTPKKGSPTDLSFRYASPTPEKQQKFALVKETGTDTISVVDGCQGQSVLLYTPKRIRTSGDVAYTTTPSKTELSRIPIKIEFVKESSQPIVETFTILCSRINPDKEIGQFKPELTTGLPNVSHSKGFSFSITTANIIKQLLNDSTDAALAKRDQNKVMDNMPASKHAEAFGLQGYQRTIGHKINNFEWGHLAEYKLLTKFGLQPQIKANLVAMTKEANTAMMIIEGSLRKLLKKYDESKLQRIDVSVSALLKSGTEIAEKIIYSIVLHAINKSSLTLTIELDALSTVQPSSVVKEAIQNLYLYKAAHYLNLDIQQPISRVLSFDQEIINPNRFEADRADALSPLSLAF